VTLDFGDEFPGADRWLEIGVRTNGGGDFAVVSPRQALTATPYAVRAGNASSVAAANVTGTIPLTQLPVSVVTNGASNVNLTGTFSGNGAGVTNVPGAIPTVISSGTNVQMQANAGYEAKEASQVVFSLPTNAVAGDVVRVYGVGAGGWQVDPASGQTINDQVTWTEQDNTNRGWYAIASSADGSKLVGVEDAFHHDAGLIHTSTDGGTNWTTREVAVGWGSVASSADGTKLVAAQPFYGLIYTSTDGGTNWTMRDDYRWWNSVASSADGSKLVAVEFGGQVYTSVDSGTNWTAQETNRNWQSVASSADGSKLVAAVAGEPIYTSTDGGTNWTAQETNRNWQSVASSADGSKLVAAVNGGQIYTSTDGGTNWTARATNGSWNSVASSADGNRLVAVPLDGHAYISSDGGTNWTAQGTNFGFFTVACSADGTKVVAAVNEGQVYTASPTPLNGAQGTSIELYYSGGGLWQTASKLDAANLFGTVSAPLTFEAPLTVSAHLGLSAQNTLEFDAGDPFKQADAGKIGYQVFSDGLDIVGAGTSGSNRKISFYAEGGSTFDGPVGATAFSGAGSNLTSLNASQLVSGTVPDARLSANVALRSGSNTFTGDQIITNGKVGIGTTSPQMSLQVGDDSAAGSQGMIRLGSRTSNISSNASRTWDIGVPQTGDDATGVGYSFVINDATVASTRLIVKWDSGNVGIGTINPTNKLQVNGGITCTALNQTSDRNAKENFKSVSPQEVLDKVAALPITTWNFKNLKDGRHMGPMAQDFYATFGLGSGETTITSVDPDGVALAAIQGLNQRLEAKSQRLEAENAELKSRLDKLERLLESRGSSR
jgi:hypothetical protein